MTEPTPEATKKPPPILAVADLIKFVGNRRVVRICIDDGISSRLKAVQHFQIRKDNFGRCLVVVSVDSIFE